MCYLWWFCLKELGGNGWVLVISFWYFEVMFLVFFLVKNLSSLFFILWNVYRLVFSVGISVLLKLKSMFCIFFLRVVIMEWNILNVLGVFI